MNRMKENRLDHERREYVFFTFLSLHYVCDVIYRFVA